MATQIKSNQILAAQGMELVVLLDDLGTENHLYLAITDAANRDTNIAAAKSEMDANVAAIQAYAGANNVTIPGVAAAPAPPVAGNASPAASTGS